MPDQVLILTHRRDHYVTEVVAEGLRRRGALAVRLDTDAFPSGLQLTARYGLSVESNGLRAPGMDWDADRIRAVWARKFWDPEAPEGLDAHVAAGCLRESRAALHVWLEGLSDRVWVDPIQAVEGAGNKGLQLRLASELGLTVPRTCITNDPAEVRDFHRDHGPLITKMLTPLSVSMDGAGPFVHSSPVSEADLQDLDGLQWSPMVFQEAIPKQVELRVILVGKHCFVGGIDASGSLGGQFDWRGSTPEEAPWREADLPAPIVAQLQLLMERLGLGYGAADLIVTPDGDHVFLELNPRGEWGMLERDLGLQIGDAIAALLLGQ